jgi:hypothetical protein
MRRDFKGFGLLLDASGKGEVSNAAIDVQLGRVPNLDAHCIIEPKLEVEDHAYNFIRIYDKYCELLREGKTLVVSNDLSCKVPGITYSSKNVFDILSLANATYRIRSSEKPDKKSKILKSFAEAEGDTLLASSVSYVSKGFNLPCNTLIVLDLNGRMTIQAMLQMIGRVRRVQTGISTVKVYLISSNKELWKIFPSLSQKTTYDIQYITTHIGGIEAIRNMGINIRRNEIAPNSYSVLVSSDVPRTNECIPEKVYPKIKIDPGYYRSPKDHKEVVGVHKNYSAVLLSSGCSAIIQVIEKKSGLLCFMENYVRTGSPVSLTRRIVAGDAIELFERLFLRFTGNCWKHVDNFVMYPDRAYFMGHEPIDIPLAHFNAIKVDEETVRRPALLQTLGVRPSDIFGSIYEESSPKRQKILN